MIRAVPQTYRGVRFRSTLEADWACTLDYLDIGWQYEPEAVQLPSGEFYRPDFYLPHLTTWLEVKGPHDERIEKVRELAEAVIHDPGCSSGDPLDHGCWHSPWQLVVIGRASTFGQMVFEAAHPDHDVDLALCHNCQHHHFHENNGVWVCRFCRIVGKEAGRRDFWESADSSYGYRTKPFWRAPRDAA